MGVGRRTLAAVSATVRRLFVLRKAMVPGAIAGQRLRQYRRDRGNRRWGVAPTGSWQPGALRSETTLDVLESGALFIPFSGSQSVHPRIAPRSGKPEVRPAKYTSGDPATESDPRS